MSDNTSDLIQWLREPCGLQDGQPVYSKLRAKAADEIERLQKRVTELEANEAAYERIVGPKTYQEVADDLALRQKVECTCCECLDKIAEEAP